MVKAGKLYDDSMRRVLGAIFGPIKLLRRVAIVFNENCV